VEQATIVSTTRGVSWPGLEQGEILAEQDFLTAASTFARGLKKDRYLESIQASFLLLPSYRRFPSDDEFQRDLQVKNLYNFRSRSYWLRRLETMIEKSGCR
jgi:hypothetical protein